MHAFIVELPNRPGSLADVAQVIADRGINISGIAGATCGESGAVGIITNDEEGTRSALQGPTFKVREVDLVSASLVDQPGTLASAARRLADAGVNVEFLAPTGMEAGRINVAIGVDNLTAAQQALGDLVAASR